MTLRSKLSEYMCSPNALGESMIFLHISYPIWTPYALTASSLSLMGSSASRIDCGTRVLQARHALEAAVRLDGHDARQDLGGDARRAAVVHELQEDVRVVEQLSVTMAERRRRTSP